MEKIRTTVRIAGKEYTIASYDSEEYVWAQITRTHTPSYGPGAEYAKAKYEVSAGTQVKAFYRQNGYLLFEIETAGGMQRAWATPESWR